MPLNFIILFPSTMIRLEIAFTSVSMLLTVSEIAKIIIITDKKIAWSFNSKVKNARSGTTFEFWELATRPEKPIMNTIGTIIIKEIIKLFFKTLLFLAA